jgi:hypothetical protein
MAATTALRKEPRCGHHDNPALDLLASDLGAIAPVRKAKVLF